MGMTMTQKILAAHAGLERVEAGQLIEANLDLVLAGNASVQVLSLFTSLLPKTKRILLRLT